MKANYKENTAIVKKDKWGFTLANFNSVLPFGPKSFAFLMHSDQVYFVEAREESGWKVVLRKEMRGSDEEYMEAKVCQKMGYYLVLEKMKTTRDFEHHSM